jgi:hypothetical protein
MNTNLITEREIMLLRDTMKLSKLKEITNNCKAKFGFVDHKHIFITMGYEHAYNDKWYNVQTK